jgi:NADH-quinone oxidoreductase subunit I
MSGYFKDIRESVQTLSNGLKLTLEHLWDARSSRKPLGVEDPGYFDQEDGIATLQYPYDSLPVPDNGRYRLHNEIDDCIVCDKCAKICPVNCIDIEPIRSTEEFGKTSDGTPKRIYAAKFDIDMAKCCFCGLCTTVCPTECLTMTKVHDFSEFDVQDHNYAFAEMTPLEILEKKKAFEESQALKDKEKLAKVKPAKPVQAAVKPKVAGTSKGKPVFKPRPQIKRKKDGE